MIDYTNVYAVNVTISFGLQYIITYICKIVVYLYKIANYQNMNQRIQQFLAAENISQSQFADTINVARATVSHIISGRNKPGFDFIESVSRHYPNLNIEWLITGKGKMYKIQDSAMKPVTAPDDVYQDDLFGNSDTVAQSYSSSSTPKVTVTDMPGYIKEAAENYEKEDLDNIPVSSEIAAADKALKRTYEVKTQPSALKHQVEQAKSHSIRMYPDRKIQKIIVFFDDNTFQELRAD